MQTSRPSTGVPSAYRFWPGAEAGATVLLGLMVSLPFVLPLQTLPIPSFYAEWWALLLGLLALVALVALAPITSGQPLWVPGIALAPLALMAVALLQWVLGMFAYAATAATWTLMLLWAALMAVAGQTLVRRVGERHLTSRLAWFLFAGGLLNALCGGLQYLGWWQALGGLVSAPLDLSRFGIYGNVAQENHFATHMALALVSACYLWFSRQLKTRWLVLAGLPCLVALALSGSRSTHLYLLWMVALSLSLQCGRAARPSPKRLALWAVVAVLALVLLVWVVVLLSPASPQLQRLLSFSSAVGPRMTLWQHATTLFLQQPVLGIGFDAFAYRLVGQLHPSTDPVVWGVDQYAHNLVLQLLAVSGVCGLLAVAVPLLAGLRRMWAAAHSVEKLWSGGVMGILLIHSMLEQPLFYGYFLGVFALAAGVADPKAWAAAAGVKARAVFVAACGLALLFLLKTANDYDNIQSHFYSARHVGSNPAQQWMAEREVVHDLRKFSLFSALAELAAPEHVVPPDASAADKIAFNQRVMRHAPVAEVEFRHAALLAEDRRMADANRQFARAAFAYPHDAAHYLTRIQALAAADSATYGPLAEFAAEWMRTRRHPDSKP